MYDIYILFSCQQPNDLNLQSLDIRNKIRKCEECLD